MITLVVTSTNLSRTKQQSKVPPTFQEMAHQSKVEVGPEAETHFVIQLLEVPFQRLPSLHHALLQRLKER